MKKILVTMMALVLTIAAQAERIDSTQFVAFYNYTIQTQDDEGQNVAVGSAGGHPCHVLHHCISL